MKVKTAVAPHLPAEDIPYLRRSPARRQLSLWPPISPINSVDLRGCSKTGGPFRWSSSFRRATGVPKYDLKHTGHISAAGTARGDGALALEYAGGHSGWRLDGHVRGHRKLDISANCNKSLQRL